MAKNSVKEIYAASAFILDSIGEPYGRVLVVQRPDNETSGKRALCEGVGGKKNPLSRTTARDLARECFEEVDLVIPPSAFRFFDEGAYSYQGGRKIVRVQRFVSPRPFGQTVKIPERELRHHDRFHWVTAHTYEDHRYVAGVRDTLATIFRKSYDGKTILKAMPGNKEVSIVCVDANFDSILFVNNTEDGSLQFPQMHYYNHGNFVGMIRSAINTTFSRAPFVSEKESRGRWTSATPLKEDDSWDVIVLYYLPQLVDAYRKREETRGHVVLSTDFIKKVLTEQIPEDTWCLRKARNVRKVIKQMDILKRGAKSSRKSPSALLPPLLSS